MLVAALWMMCNLLAFAGPPDAPAEKSATAPQTITYHGQDFLIRTVDPKTEDVELFWKDDQGNALRDFASLEKAVNAKGEKLVFAANAGMFEADSRPVGLLVQNGSESTPLNLNDAAGNFYMKPNGVFLINDKHEARVIESGDYPTQLSPTIWATQSGPMLVHGGTIHPDFVSDSKNVAIRSGVGVRKDGSIVFAISKRQINFYSFAALFLNHFKCPNALFLDGTISEFYSPGFKDAFPHIFGPMIGIVEPVKKP